MPEQLTRRVLDALGRPSWLALVSIAAAAAIAFAVAFAVASAGSGGDREPVARRSGSPGAAVPVAVTLRRVALLPDLRRDRMPKAPRVVAPVATAASTGMREPVATPTSTPTVVPEPVAPVAPVAPQPQAPPSATPEPTFDSAEPEPTFDSSG